METAEQYVEEILSGHELRDEIALRGREPGCYLVFKTNPKRDGAPDGMPLGIYATREGLRKHFPGLIGETEQGWGYTICSYWFDD